MPIRKGQNLPKSLPYGRKGKDGVCILYTAGVWKNRLVSKHNSPKSDLLLKSAHSKRPKTTKKFAIWPKKKRESSRSVLRGSSSSTIRKGGVLPYFDLSLSMQTWKPECSLARYKVTRLIAKLRFVIIIGNQVITVIRATRNLLHLSTPTNHELKKDQKWVLNETEMGLNVLQNGLQPKIVSY